MTFAFCVVLWVVAAIVIAKYAQKKGLDFTTYLVTALFLSAIITLVVVLLKKTDRDAAAANVGLKKCAWCAEFVQSEALICKHCGRNFPIMSGGIVIEE